MTFYLKYRPQKLDELVGQEQVVQAISVAFKNDKLSHAYLFVGPKGTGKTSTARILAKMVNCEEVSRGERVSQVPRGEKPRDTRDTLTTRGTLEVPCNKCTTCLSITDGSNLDLIEIDAASNRGIDDIRNLREKIKLAPTSARKKVYIIDEVHMLTPEAFNALLKTLEEPPLHALFILATTESSKVPPTILSRVVRLDFKLAKLSELLEVLTRIVAWEKIQIDGEALKFVAKKADGSFRDGVKLLDQISTLEGRITLEKVEESLKSSQFEDLISFLENLAKKSTSDSLMEVSKQVEKGRDVKELILSTMDLIRNIMLIKNGLGEQLVKPHFVEDKYKELSKLADKFFNKDLIYDLDVLQVAYEKLKFSSIPQLPLELAVVKICSSEYSENSVSQMKSDKLEYRKISEPVDQKKEDIPKVSNTLIHRSTDTPISSDLSDTPSSSDPADILKLKEKWTFVLETIRPYNFSLEALLRSTTISECTEEEVILEVPYSFHQRILEAPKNKDLLSSIFSDILGRSMQIAVSLGNRPKKQEDVANVEIAQDDEIIRIASEIFNSDTVN